jgi:hypothetical protein
MKNTRLWSVLVAFASFCCASALAQPKVPARGEISWTLGESPELAAQRRQLEVLKQRYTDSHPQITEVKRQIAALEERGPYLLSLDFPGGPLSGLLTLLAQVKVVSFNVINASDVDDLAVELSPFTLRNAPVKTVFEVLRNMLVPRGLELTPSMDGGNPNAIVAVLARHGSGAKRVAPPAFDSFALGQHLATHSIDDILSAIRLGWELDPAHDRDALRLKFHPATSILLVSGPPDAIMVASKIISQIKPTPKVEARSASGGSEPPKR